jgi:hypothetical protein
MKLSYLIFCLFLLCELKGQVKDSTNFFWTPNGVYLYKNINIDQTEIANIHWLEFMMDSSNLDKESFYKPDMSVWEAEILAGNIDSTDIDNFRDYYRHPKFRFYPVVGVSYAQVEKFCEWRSKVVTQSFQKSFDKENIKLKKKGFYYQIEVVYRLPTETEWEMATKANLDIKKYPYGMMSIYEKPYKKLSAKKIVSKLDTIIEHNQLKKDIDIYNSTLSEFSVNCQKNSQDFPYFIRKQKGFKLISTPEYIFSHQTNDMNCYNLIGNVAEMVLEKGIAKGGSWKHSIVESKIENRLIYDSPKVWLGFRCVCEVNLKKILIDSK